MRSVLAGVTALALGVFLVGCETPAAPATTSAAVIKPACEKREVTGSRLARCDDKDVRVISGEEIRNTGMPSAGAGRGAETR